MYAFPIGFFPNFPSSCPISGVLFNSSGDLGYRLSLLIALQIDSAKAYHNEVECGEAIRASGLKRSDVFFTTKVPKVAMGYQKTKDAIDSSLKAANFDYIDL